MSARAISVPRQAQPRERSPELAAFDIYDGQVFLGSVVERASGQYEAAPARGASLGLYTSREAAAHAVVLSGVSR
jgi:hypothetical protein